MLRILKVGSRHVAAGRAVAALVLLASMLAHSAHAGSHRWDFGPYNDRQGWAVSPNGLGVVMGGALWVALNPREADPAKIAAPMYQDHADMMAGIEDPGTEILSPRGLDVGSSTAQQVQVKLRVLNLSPTTDLFLRWRTKEQTSGWGETDGKRKVFHETPQSRRCVLIADLKRWQDVTCHVDKQWRGIIDQIAIYNPLPIRGDMWISSIEIGVGPSEPERVRPDLASESVVPKLSVPGVTQAGFIEAFKVLDRNLIVDVPQYGFTHPYVGAGGMFNSWGWWVMDSSAAVAGAKWANPIFAEGVMEGFHDVQAQNPDGRIDEAGISAVRGQPGDVSQPPLFFEAAFDVARRTSNLPLREEIYQTMHQYLDWWLSCAKRDLFTGLVSAVVDETFGEPEYLNRSILPQSVAPVSLNVEVAVGAARTAALAAALGKVEESQKYRQAFQDLSHAINRWMWDEQDGAYYSYDLRQHQLRKRLIVTTFDPLRLGIAPAERRDRLLKRLLDPAQFNWGRRPLTSLAMTEPDYTEKKGMVGGYNGWNGPIWTYRNMPIVSGLKESGRSDLATELNWATIKAFHNNYWEFVLPSSRKGGSEASYSMSASHYIAAIVENLFGVDYDSMTRRTRIMPHVPTALYGKPLALENLILPTGADTRLSVFIQQSSDRAAKITTRITGPLPAGDLQIMLPDSGKEIVVPMQTKFTASFP